MKGLKRVLKPVSSMMMAFWLVVGCSNTGLAQTTEVKPKLIGSIAGNSAPLHTETLTVSGAGIESGTITVGFYEWPLRVDQPALISVEGALPQTRTSIQLQPDAAVNALVARAMSQPDGALPDVSWHELTAIVQGRWTLQVKVRPESEASKGFTPALVSVDALAPVASLPLVVEGPPAMPRWLAWLIAASPLMMLAVFVRKLNESIEHSSSEETPWWEGVARSYGAYRAAASDSQEPSP